MESTDTSERIKLLEDVSASTSGKTQYMYTKRDSETRCKLISIPFILNIVLAISLFVITKIINDGALSLNDLGFYCKDPNLSYKYKGESVTLLALLIGSFSIPLLALIIIEILSKGNIVKINLWKIWFFYRISSMAIFIIVFIGTLFKLLIGAPRPDFFDICEPDTGKTCIPNTFVETFNCTSKRFTKEFQLDSVKSFFSGHAATSTFVAVFTSHLLQTRLSTLSTGLMFKTILILLCFTWSIVCSLTRITDRRHHWWDVLAGAIIGTIVALYAIRLIKEKRIEEKKRRDTSVEE